MLLEDAQARWRRRSEYVAETGDPVRGSDIDMAVDNRGRDELVACPERVPASGRLVRVVQLHRQIAGIIGVQDRRVRILDSPDNPVRAAGRGDARSRSWKWERTGACRRRRQ